MSLLMMKLSMILMRVYLGMKYKLKNRRNLSINLISGLRNLTKNLYVAYFRICYPNFHLKHFQIKRYPRTIEQSLRKTDDRRKTKRAETKERKKKEKEEKMAEIRKMQELKRKEIEEKLEKLKEVTGNTHLAFEDDDLDGDFDPEAHDRRMKELFNDQFYEGPEGDQKPQFPTIDEELEIGKV